MKRESADRAEGTWTWNLKITEIQEIPEFLEMSERHVDLIPNKSKQEKDTLGSLPRKNMSARPLLPSFRAAGYFYSSSPTFRGPTQGKRLWGTRPAPVILVSGESPPGRSLSLCCPPVRPSI